MLGAYPLATCHQDITPNTCGFLYQLSIQLSHNGEMSSSYQPRNLRTLSQAVNSHINTDADSQDIQHKKHYRRRVNDPYRRKNAGKAADYN